MLILPTGVVATNGCSRTVRPYDVSSDSMYLRVAASAGEPAGRGPNATCFRTSSRARAPSNGVVEAGRVEAGVGAAFWFDPSAPTVLAPRSLQLGTTSIDTITSTMRA